MAPAAFKTPPQAPPTFIETPESVLKETHRLIDWARSRQDKLVAQIKPAEATFENAVLPGTRDEDALGLEVNLLGFYQAVSSSAKLRDASTEADRLLNDFAIESSMREDVYKLYDAVLKKGEKLDAESQRLAEKSYKNFIQNGLNIPAGPKRERFREIAKRLSELAITFSRNLNEEKGGLWFTPEELEGVPQDVTSTLKRGEGENEAKLWLTFKYPDYFPTMKYAKHAATRKRVRIAYDNKTNQNVPLFTETIILRDEAARLLGYPNHAAFKIEDKMAESPEAVDSFLADLRKRLKGGGEEEANVLKAMKKADLEARGLEKEFDNHYFIWDHNFYDRLLLEKHYSLNHQKIAEYFPLSTSIRGMMHIFEEIFGMVFVEILDQDRAAISPTGKGEDIVWHPDVQIFSVWDDEGEGGEFVGYLYLDLHPREGKYGHAANFNLQPGFKYDNGTRRYPATALVCNFSKPTKTKPSLLKHDEVVTLFHELGHGIHDLVSRTKYSRFHGTRTVQDFVEAPSQMLENWCWTPSQIKALSHHYSSLSASYLDAWKAENASSSTPPPEKIPDDVIENLVRTKHVNGALHYLRQLHFGIFDMRVHEPSSHEEIENLDATVVFNTLRSEIAVLEGPEVLGYGKKWGNGEATFGHLLGGYDAGYYGYLASQVYSTDMFYTIFKKDPMNPNEGRRYRHMVLEKGGSQDEMKTLTDFLGRPPNSDAFYEELGVPSS